MRQAIVGIGVAVSIATAFGAQTQRPSGVMLGDLAWPDAGRVLTPTTVVVLPLGGGAVQHGPHLRLNNDERLVRYLTGRVHAASSVVIAPPLTYHFYPTFLDYTGSTSLSHNTARDTTVEIVRTLAKYGPRRFYVLNTGETAMFPLRDAAETLAADGLLLGYTDMRYHLNTVRATRRQPAERAAFHADEVITSMMLAIDPAAVDMSKAVRTASGVVGDPTLATKEQGQAYVEALVGGVVDDIEAIRAARLPTARPVTTTAPPAPRPQPQRPAEEVMPNGCTAGEERAIRTVGERFSYLWRQMDALEIAKLFTANGDIRHPDDTIERGFDTIFQNRLELFRSRDYRGSVHPVQLNDIRCLAGGTAIADGKWELRFDQTPAVESQRRGLGPNRRHAGLCTLVVVKRDSVWAIQAWRYTINPPDGEPPPTTLKQPGFLPRRGGGGDD